MVRKTPVLDGAGPLAWTDDTLLGGRVRYRQPAGGYRAAIDPVLLAAAVPAQSGDSVLDVGAGAGAALLCVARRVAGCRLTGLERAPELAVLAAHNIAANEFGSRAAMLTGDLLAPPGALVPGSFDHVMANPPYDRPGAGTVPPDAAKAAAQREGAAGLADWLKFCLEMVRPKGTVTLIHRAERLPELLSGLAAGAGGIVVLPLWPKEGVPAKRVIVQARRAARSPARLEPGLVLHREDGGYTAAAEAVLRDGKALPL